MIKKMSSYSSHRKNIYINKSNESIIIINDIKKFTKLKKKKILFYLFIFRVPQLMVISSKRKRKKMIIRVQIFIVKFNRE